MISIGVYRLQVCSVNFKLYIGIARIELKLNYLLCETVKNRSKMDCRWLGEQVCPEGVFVENRGTILLNS